MRRYAATVALVALAACGGGGGPAPRATSSGTPSASATPAPTSASPTPTGVVVSPEARPLRQAVAKTLASCPCFVTMTVGVESSTPYVTHFGGTYDPKVAAVALAEIKQDGEPTGRGIGIGSGRMFVKPAGATTFYELDFGKLPAPATTPLVPYALANPTVVLSAAANVSSAVAQGDTEQGTEYTALFDSGGIVKAAGPWAPLLRRILTTPTVQGELAVKNGRLTRVELTTPETFGGTHLFVTVRIGDDKEEKPPSFPLPRSARKVDVTREKV
ncbi:MAG TPA: hypothetical protein VGX28_02735 [Frankiaceae bacterium]|jgi:hypothetical protein|nr:hypothetical protein [Frankiaceae bacterium]